jgi:RNA recognition motif-containing protein
MTTQSNETNGRRVYIQNLKFNLRPHEVREWFLDENWDVTDLYVPAANKGQGKFINRGFCFVEFGTEEEAEQAVEELNGTTGPGGRTWYAKIAEPRGHRNE